jgi:hypothetical protein
MAKVSVTVPIHNAMESFAESIAKAVREDTIEKLAERYGFDAEEAKAVLTGGVHLEKEVKILPRHKLPYSGPVQGNCKGIIYGDGLYPQCPGKPKDGDWCTKCAKQMAKDETETPTYGDIVQREDVDYFSYKVGSRGLKHYWNYMQKHGLTAHQVLASAELHGFTIDPRHLEPKSIVRGRRESIKKQMETQREVLHGPAVEANQDEANQDEANQDEANQVEANQDEANQDEANQDEANQVDSEDETADKAAADIAAEAKTPETNDLEGEVETYTAEIEAMPIGELRKLAESCAIATTENGKPIVPKRLRKIMCEHFDKAAADKDKAAAEKAATEKAATEKAATEKAEKAAAEKAATEKAAAEKAVAEKAAAEKAATEKAAAEKAAKSMTKIPETNELEEGELEEEEVEEEETYTAEEIEAMPIGELRKLAESCAIATTENGRQIVPKRLRKILCEHFEV